VFSARFFVPAGKTPHTRRGESSHTRRVHTRRVVSHEASSDWRLAVSIAQSACSCSDHQAPVEGPYAVEPLRGLSSVVCVGSLSWPHVALLRLQRLLPSGGGGVGSPLQIGVWAEGELLGVFGREEEEGEVRSGPGAAMPSSSTQCGHPVIALAAPPCVACEGSTCSCDHGQIPNEGAAGSKDAELGAFRPNTCRWICSGFFQG
jgi:hypothetical protein